MRHGRILLFIAALALGILSCRAVSIQVKTEVVCKVPKDFLPANNNTWNIYRADNKSLGGVIEYKNDTLSVYTEPGHKLSQESPVPPTQAIAATLTITEEGSATVLKTIDLIVCGGQLYVRETNGQPPSGPPLQQGYLNQKESAFGALPFSSSSRFFSGHQLSLPASSCRTLLGYVLSCRVFPV